MNCLQHFLFRASSRRRFSYCDAAEEDSPAARAGVAGGRRVGARDAQADVEGGLQAEPALADPQAASLRKDG